MQRDTKRQQTEGPPNRSLGLLRGEDLHPQEGAHSLRGSHRDPLQIRVWESVSGTDVENTCGGRSTWRRGGPAGGNSGTHWRDSQAKREPSSFGNGCILSVLALRASNQIQK